MQLIGLHEYTEQFLQPYESTFYEYIKAQVFCYAYFAIGFYFLS
jgi:hypothetical protein